MQRAVSPLLPVVIHRILHIYHVSNTTSEFDIMDKHYIVYDKKFAETLNGNIHCEVANIKLHYNLQR